MFADTELNKNANRSFFNRLRNVFGFLVAFAGANSSLDKNRSTNKRIQEVK
jgi:hypothetical protein